MSEDVILPDVRPFRVCSRMNKEYKFIPLASFKAVDDGSGGYKGYPTLWDEIDEGGDLIPRGAYLDTIPEFLHKGFGAHSHDWNFSQTIAYPMEAKEDEKGFYFESKFHSTPDAQMIRTKVQERIADGKFVGLSIGFQTAATPITIYPKDYEKELSKYVSTEALDRVLARAKEFPKVRVLPKINLYEVSIVTSPMLKVASVTAVKSDGVSVKGMFEDRLTERTNSFHNLCETLSFVIYRIQYMASQAEEAGTSFDAESILDEALNEFTSRLKASVMEKLGTNESFDFYYYSSNLSNLLSTKSDAVSAKTLGERSELVVSALSEFAQLGAVLTEQVNSLCEHGKSKHEFRTKEGRTISQATATRIEEAQQQVKDTIPALEAVDGALTDLLALAKPKEKVDVSVLVSNFQQMQFERLAKTVRR